MPKQMNMTVGGALGAKLEHKRRLETAKPNSIAVKHEELLDEWDWEENNRRGLDPYVITYGSGLSCAWICSECGNPYDAFPYRRSRGSGCNECAKKNRGKVKHDKLSVEYPELAAQWDYEKNDGLTPDDVTSGSEKDVYWLCPEHGHSYHSKVRSRTTGGNGCPYCAGKAVLEGFNDLATVYPDLASEWHPTKNGTLTPSQLTYASQVKVWWICYKHGEPYAWKAPVNNRSCRNSGCPICGRERITAAQSTPGPGESLAEKNPRLASEWHPTKNGGLTP